MFAERSEQAAQNHLHGISRSGQNGNRSSVCRKGVSRFVQSDDQQHVSHDDLAQGFTVLCSKRRKQIKSIIEISNQGCSYDLEIVDSAGQDEHSVWHEQQAIGVDGFILVYSVVNRKSFDVVKVINEKILDACGTEKIARVLVGNKLDMRAKREVSTEEGEPGKKQTRFFDDCFCVFGLGVQQF